MSIHGGIQINLTRNLILKYVFKHCFTKDDKKEAGDKTCKDLYEGMY